MHIWLLIHAFWDLGVPEKVDDRVETCRWGPGCIAGSCWWLRQFETSCWQSRHVAGVANWDPDDPKEKNHIENLLNTCTTIHMRVQGKKKVNNHIPSAQTTDEPVIWVFCYIGSTLGTHIVWAWFLVFTGVRGGLLLKIYAWLLFPGSLTSSKALRSVCPRVVFGSTNPVQAMTITMIDGGKYAWVRRQVHW